MQYNLNLTHVLYFCQIVEHKSMSQAADVLHIAQPSLSMAIKKLEENLGFSLFERKNRQLYLTPQGKAFYEEAKLLVEHSRALEERIDDIKANKHRIRLGISPMISSSIIPLIFDLFAKDHPHIEFEIVETGVLQLQSLLQKQKLDVAFLNQNTSQPIDIQFHQLFQSQYHLYVGENDPLRQVYEDKGQQPLTIQDYYQSPMVFYRHTSYIQTQLTKAFEEHHYLPRILMRTTQIQTVKQLVKNSVACAFLIDISVLPQDCLYQIETEHSFTVDVGIAYNTHSTLTEDLETFIAFLKSLHW